MLRSNRGVVLWMFCFILFAGLIYPILQFEDKVLFVVGANEYLGAFLVGLVTNATLFVPGLTTTAPVLMIIGEIANGHSVFLVAPVYAFGATLGETTAYLGGRVGRKLPVVARSRLTLKVESWMRGHSTGRTLFVLAATPVFPFDAGGLIAGAMRYPLLKFWIATFLGRTIKYMAVITLWLEGIKLGSWMVQVQLPLTIGLGSAALLFGAVLILYGKKRIWTLVRFRAS